MIRSFTIGRRTHLMLSDPDRDLYHEVRRKPRATMIRSPVGRGPIRVPAGSASGCHVCSRNDTHECCVAWYRAGGTGDGPGLSRRRHLPTAIGGRAPCGRSRGRMRAPNGPDPHARPLHGLRVKVGPVGRHHLAAVGRSDQGHPADTWQMAQLYAPADVDGDDPSAPGLAPLPWEALPGSARQVELPIPTPSLLVIA